MTSLCYDPETASFVPEAELRCRHSSRRFDPEFAEKRKAWLREQHRAPLKERAFDVLGNDGPALLKELRASNPAGCDDNHLRYILRAAARIPAHGENLERRHKYIRACIRDRDSAREETAVEEAAMKAQEIIDAFHLLNPEEVRELSDDDWREYRAALRACSDSEKEAEKTPFQRLVDRVGQEQAGDCCVRLHKVYSERWPDSPEKAAENVRRIIHTAATRKYPIRYISAVVMNERRDARLRSRKRDQKKGERKVSQ